MESTQSGSGSETLVGGPSGLVKIRMKVKDLIV
jgi:hypothetical protein